MSFMREKKKKALCDPEAENLVYNLTNIGLVLIKYACEAIASFSAIGLKTVSNK